MTGRVVGEKIRRPEPAGLSRPRLEQRLLGSRDAGLALVVAPPGSGKTTLLAQVAALTGRRTAWYCVGPEDASESAFVGHLAHALGSITSAVDASTESVDELLLALQTATQPLTLVADDLHEVTGSPAEVALERLVRLRPRSLRVLLGSRRTPDINTPRLLASGELVELGVDDLRFRSWEVEELYRRVYDEPLSPEAAAALTRRTGGWAAGLQLFHLSTAGKERSERESAVAELNGRSRLIRSYLTHNLIADLPTDRRDFLVSTSTLGVLTGQLCDELLETTGSLSVLEDLESGHFFTTSTDDGQTFRYHEILRSHLEVLLIGRSSEAAALELYARAGTILEGHGFGQAALRAYARAQEWGAVARLVRDSRSGLSVDEVLNAPGCRAAPLSREDPWMALSQARCFVRHGDLAAATLAYERAVDLADDERMRHEAEAEVTVVRLWTPPTTDALGAEAPDALVSSNHAAVSASSVGSEAWSEASTASVVRQATVMTLPGAAGAAPTALGRAVVHLLGGRIPEARQALGATDGIRPDAGWEGIALRLLIVLVGVIDGTIRDPSRQLEELTLHADAQGYAWLARIGRGMHPWVLPAGADRSSDAGSPDISTPARDGGDDWGRLFLGFVAGAALVRQGRGAEASPVLRDVAAAAADLGAPVVGLWASALALHAEGVDRGEARPVDCSGERRDRCRQVLALAASLGVVGVDVWNRPVSGRDLGFLTEPTKVTTHGDTPDARTVVSALAAVGEGKRIELVCLGGLVLRIDGEPVDLGSLRPRARTLLNVLSVHHGHDVHREELIDVLWPDAPIEVGAHRLHVAASSVRRLLTLSGCGATPVRRNGDAYRLDLQDVRSDLADVENEARAMATARGLGQGHDALTRGLAALARYGGPLLPEVGPADWVVGERARLRVLATSVAIDVARLAHELGRPDDGRRAAQRAVELDPLRDTGWLLLAQHQEALGEPTAAATTRREHERILSVLEARY